MVGQGQLYPTLLYRTETNVISKVHTTSFRMIAILFVRSVIFNLTHKQDSNHPKAR